MDTVDDRNGRRGALADTAHPHGVVPVARGHAMQKLQDLLDAIKANPEVDAPRA